MEGEEFDNKQEKENTTRIIQIIIATQINISIIIFQLQNQLHKREGWFGTQGYSDSDSFAFVDVYMLRNSHMYLTFSAF